ncbi:uncharacterized protein METZ01_LOCUS968 [marine metagenome]|uniref:Uncharacterized protein n=1 Tax=marine metagenome TaxID=408172 RepID=A0A381N241_9ZZZZ
MKEDSLEAILARKYTIFLLFFNVQYLNHTV